MILIVTYIVVLFKNAAFLQSRHHSKSAYPPLIYGIYAGLPSKDKKKINFVRLCVHALNIVKWQNYSLHNELPKSIGNF